MAEKQPWANEDWVETLHHAVATHGRAEVTDRLDCSQSLLTQLLKGVYSSPIEKWKRRVEAEFERDAVECPVLGEITADRCREERNKGFSASNPIRVKLSQTCPTCPHNPDAKDRSDHE